MKSLSQFSDDELIKLYVEGDGDSINALIKRHKDRLLSYIILNVRQQALAEDIFQDSVIKVFLSLRSGHYKSDGKFLAWAMRIAHNLIADYYRHSKYMRTISNDETPIELFVDTELISDVSIESKMVHEQSLSEVASLLPHLPDCQRKVVEMRHYCDMSFKDIAEETQVSINTALGRMRYGIINLRRMMSERERMCV